MTLSIKQFTRIVKNFENKNYLPIHIVINDNFFKNKYLEKSLNNDFKIYYSANECFYGKAPCTNYKNNFKNIEYIKKFNYHICIKLMNKIKII